ncbi:o-succinylbenzoate--CoA ligase [Oceanobacillus chungangensis]|uniref:O-succinylbenzoate--CoA ligase n=1 Tax=Oceanobacillus chungangensis TaxID=1229152 RepID=A0A3D8PUK6_9BACI|nr:o-succinylbenzoate--CoA ligase [Oceanobacillus chungangensis]RDW18948.1 o-succinylbenzoate--CoA ligase [Oceanobacillus chungangensis]
MEQIAYWIHKRADITPNRMALITERSEDTYEMLSSKVNNMAAFLQNECQLKKGDRVAILSQNSAEYMISYFAIAQLGLVAVPLNIRLTATELAFQINDSGAKTILFETETSELYREICNHVYFVNAYLMEKIGKATEKNVRHVAVDAANDAYIICYTSGTTGRPKGAVLTQENMFWNAINCQYALDITSMDNTIVLLPLFHIGGIGLFAFPTLLTGGTVIIPKKFDSAKAINIIEEYGVTIVMGVPTIHEAIRKNPNFDTANFQSVRWFYSGGAPCPKELINQYLARGLPFGQGMGMTETAPTIFMLSREDYKYKVGSIGKPAMFCDIKIVDQAGLPVKKGEIGELLIKGPNVMKEYWGLPDKTKEAIRDGWFHSGDLMREDEDGFIYVAGRKKDMIISGGENIYPLEVEQVINELPEINEVAVIGITDEKWGEIPVAYLSLNNGSTKSEEEIKSYCQKRLAKYKIPKNIFILDELPKNATGKIDKSRILEFQMKSLEKESNLSRNRQ